MGTSREKANGERAGRDCESLNSLRFPTGEGRLRVVVHKDYAGGRNNRPRPAIYQIGRLSCSLGSRPRVFPKVETVTPYPNWLNWLAWFSLGTSFLCALIILVHEFKKPQKMFIMNLVWPITALYWNFITVWAYFKMGQKMTKEHQESQHGQQQNRESGESTEPSWSQVAVAVTHCGAGCTLGDIAAESSVAAFALTFAGGDFPTRLVLDFLLAWFFGIVFQYFTIAPMRNLPFGKGLVAAVKADTLSIVAFEVGLFAWMALTYFVLFPGPHLHPDEAPFWFMMQIGMVIGFFTSYPANVFLIRWGWKEKMG